jgi:hypothetical protein
MKEERAIQESNEAMQKVEQQILNSALRSIKLNGGNVTQQVYLHQTKACTR